jgi:hypothetical protein
VGDVTWGQAGKERERHMPRQASKKHSARLCRDTSHACTKSRVAASTRSFACVVCVVGLLSVSAKKKRERQGRVAMLEIDFRFQTPNCPTRAISPLLEHRASNSPTKACFYSSLRRLGLVCLLCPPLPLLTHSSLLPFLLFRHVFSCSLSVCFQATPQPRSD